MFSIEYTIPEVGIYETGGARVKVKNIRGGENVNKLIFTIRTQDGNVKTFEKTSGLPKELETKTYYFSSSIIGSSPVNKVTVTPIINDKAGIETISEAQEIKSVSDYDTSCKNILDKGEVNGDGVYFIDPDGVGGIAPFEVYCDMTTDGGGWTMVGHYRHPATENAPSDSNILQHSNLPEYSIIDDAVDSNYKLMKSFTVTKSGTFRVKFSAYIKSGTYYWAWKIGKNGGNVLTQIYGTNAIGAYTQNLEAGQTSSAHEYRNFIVEVKGLVEGDVLELWMVSSDSVGTPVAGNGQTLYAKNFEIYSFDYDNGDYEYFIKARSDAIYGKSEYLANPNSAGAWTDWRVLKGVKWPVEFAIVLDMDDNFVSGWENRQNKILYRVKDRNIMPNYGTSQDLKTGDNLYFRFNFVDSWQDVGTNSASGIYYWYPYDVTNKYLILFHVSNYKYIDGRAPTNYHYSNYYGIGVPGGINTWHHGSHLLIREDVS